VSSSPYDAIAELYDPWSRSVTEDVGFYVAEARKAGGPVVELGVGTGRIAVPIAQAGVPVIGVDSSGRMIEACRLRAESAGVEVDLRLGDLQAPPVDPSEGVHAVLCPFRSYLHLRSGEARRTALRSAHGLLPLDGPLVFDVFEPKPDDIAETQGRWLEREPGIFERAEWDERARTLTLSVRGPEGATTMALAWISHEEWLALLAETGFAVEAVYGWFDRGPYTGGEDMIYVARRA
jgi:ubiquinone/menaquinone biosynthesis C-methylase UbiE